MAFKNLLKKAFHNTKSDAKEISESQQQAKEESLTALQQDPLETLVQQAQKYELGEGNGENVLY